MSDVQAEQTNPFAQGSQPQENMVAGAPTGEPQLEMPAGGSAGAEQPPVDNAHVEEGAEQFAEVAPPKSPLELLDGLLEELEGIAHLSKSEIVAIVDKYRVLRGE